VSFDGIKCCTAVMQAAAEEITLEKRLRAAAERRAANMVSVRNEAIFAAKASESKFEVAMVC